MMHCVILALFLLADAVPVQTVSPVGKKTPGTVKIEGCKGQAGCNPVPVDIGGTSVSATTTCHATAAAPTYVEGTDDPISCDLAGSVRTSGGGGGGAVDVSDRAARLVGVIYGDQAQKLKQSATNFNTVVELAVGSGLIDPRSIRALTASDVVDVSDRVGRLLGHVTVDNASLAVTGTFWPTAAGSPGSYRLSDGAAFYDAAKTGQLPAALDGSGFLKVHEQGTAAISAASLPLPTGAATAAKQDLAQTTLDLINADTGSIDGKDFATSANQTNGTQKSIVRGGAKGTTVAADVTSTASGANHQPADVAIYDASGNLLDPRARTWLTSSGTDSVSAAQSTPAAISGAWPVKLTDGTNTTGVTASSEAKVNAPDVTATGTITAVSQNVPITLGGNKSACTLMLTGTWVGTLQFEALGRTGSFFQISGFGPLSGSTFQTTTANGNFTFTVGSFTQVRVFSTAWTSGTATVDWNCGSGIIGNMFASVDLAKVAGTTTLNGGVAGSLGVGGTQGNNAAITANPVLGGIEALSTQPTAATTGNARRMTGGLDGALYVRPFTQQWSCGLTAIGTTLTQCKAAPAAGLKAYVTDMVVISDTVTAGQITLRYGTGTNCATGVTTLFPNVASITTGKYPYPGNGAINPMYYSFATPLAPAAANAVCAVCVVTNTCTVTLIGYEAP